MIYNTSFLQLFPEHEQYKIYYAQSLQKGCEYEAAMKASFTVDSPGMKEKVVKLQVICQEPNQERLVPDWLITSHVT